ncbi:hypothetical protein EDB84DRAFT_555275 [Lactarius hengduanensis]|nr:hypothetical protein EDB84DRAFT_555275 [Lactarius hengduanensis]
MRSLGDVDVRWPWLRGRPRVAMHCGIPFPDTRSNISRSSSGVITANHPKSNLRTLVVITSDTQLTCYESILTLPRRNPRNFEPRRNHARLKCTHTLCAHCLTRMRSPARQFVHCLIPACATPAVRGTRELSACSARASHGLKASFAATRYGKDEHGHGASAMDFADSAAPHMLCVSSERGRRDMGSVGERTGTRNVGRLCVHYVHASCTPGLAHEKLVFPGSGKAAWRSSRSPRSRAPVRGSLLFCVSFIRLPYQDISAVLVHLSIGRGFTVAPLRRGLNRTEGQEERVPRCRLRCHAWRPRPWPWPPGHSIGVDRRRTCPASVATVLQVQI